MKPTILIVFFVLLGSACHTEQREDGMGTVSVGGSDMAFCTCEEDSCFCEEVGAELVDAEGPETERMPQQAIDELFVPTELPEAPYNEGETQHEEE